MEISGGAGAKAQAEASGARDLEKDELYTALMKSNMELQVQNLTKTFEDKERLLGDDIRKAKTQLDVKTKEV